MAGEWLSTPARRCRPRKQYGPHPSGTKFLFLDNVGDEKNLSIGVVLNWPSLVRPK